MLEVIDNSVSYANNIIINLQDFASTQNPMLEKTAINAVVEVILPQVKVPEHVNLVTIYADLPEIDVDRDMMTRVFMHLSKNAVQAMDKGGTLEISTRKTRGFIEISFKDTGVGVPKENVKRLFTPYFTTRAQGLGMGWAICKKFVDSHGGNIRVESEEGGGSTFTVVLPIQHEDERKSQLATTNL